MERQNAKLLEEVLGEFVKQEGLEEELYRVRLFEAWDRIVGAQASRATSNKFFKNGILYCTISSSVIRSQLYYSTEAILKRLNEEFPQRPLLKIVLK